MCDIGDDAEPFETVCETERKARKPHRCDCCSGIISAGETYLNHFSKFEGEINSEKMCAACLRDRKDFVDEHGFFTTPSDTPDNYRDCVDARDDFASMLKWSRALRRISNRRQQGGKRG